MTPTPVQVKPDRKRLDLCLVVSVGGSNTRIAALRKAILKSMGKPRPGYFYRLRAGKKDLKSHRQTLTSLGVNKGSSLNVRQQKIPLIPTDVEQFCSLHGQRKALAACDPEFEPAPIVNVIAQAMVKGLYQSLQDDTKAGCILAYSKRKSAYDRKRKQYKLETGKSWCRKRGCVPSAQVTASFGSHL